MSTIRENDRLAKLVHALEPWLGQIVIIGGWAHRLYRLDSRAQKVEYAPLMTLDTDIAVPKTINALECNIRERLIENGFVEDRLGDDKPPATHYRLENDKAGYYVEFLTPLIGNEFRRDGSRKATATVAGVVSRRFRYVEILLMAPWLVDLHNSAGFSIEQPVQVQIANPVAFLAHKILVEARRNSSERAKDFLYVHDTIEIFGAHLRELNAEWRNQIRPNLHRNQIKTVESAANRLYGSVIDDVREAARIAVGRQLTPERIREVCQLGLQEVFDETGNLPSQTP